MTQSIYKYYHVGLLGQFQDLLGWKLVNININSCYYQATRLITFDHDELTRFFHQYLSEHSADPTEMETGNSGSITSVSIGFHKSLCELKNSNNNWITTCVVFLEMPHTYLKHVRTNRVGGDVLIGFNYPKYLPVFEI